MAAKAPDDNGNVRRRGGWSLEILRRGFTQ